MPRGKVPSLLSANNCGVAYDTAVRAGKCARCSVFIAATAKIGLLRYQKAGFTNQKRLCLDCVEAIITRTQDDLDQIKTGLEAARSN